MGDDNKKIKKLLKKKMLGAEAREANKAWLM